MPIWGNVKTLFELNKSRVGMANSFEILSKEDVKYLSILRTSKGKYSRSSTYIPVVSKFVYSESKRAVNGGVKRETKKCGVLLSKR